MNIGVDSKRLLCNFTGLGNYSRTLVRNLLLYHPDNEYFLYSTHVVYRDETLPFLDSPELNIRISEAMLKSIWRSWSIKSQLKKDKIRLYHGLSNEIPFNMHRSGIRSVVTVHDLIFKIYPHTYSPIDRQIYDIKFCYACKHSDRIIAISENTKSDIIRFYDIDPDKIDVIYQACNPLFYKLRSSFENERVLKHYQIPPDFLLTVGTVEPRKNIKRIIEAMSWLSRDIPIPLVIVGKGGRYKQECETMAHQAGLDKRIIWIDRLTNNEHLQSLYQSAKALIYPSLYEGFGLPVAEALLSKTAVITSARSALKEAGGPGSIYVEPEDSQQIAAGIEKILTDEAYRQNMIGTGYGYAHQYFSPELLTKQVNDCYLRSASL
jgi:glycosyltransferase involved in cell wall biosynthesis